MRSSIPATIGRVSVATNMQPSPSHFPTRIPWSGASRRTRARNAASTATASSSPSVSFMRVKPHMSTNAKHRKTRTPTVWPRCHAHSAGWAERAAALSRLRAVSTL